MSKQTYKLLGRNHEGVGYISKDDDGRMLLLLDNFWEAITAKQMKLVNVDDFVGSIFWGKKNETAVIDCATCGSDNLTVLFIGLEHVGYVVIRVIHPVAGMVFEVNVETTEDVTGQVRLTGASDVDDLPDQI